MPLLVSHVHTLMKFAFLIPAPYLFFRAYVIWRENNRANLDGYLSAAAWLCFFFVANLFHGHLPFKRWFNFSHVSSKVQA